MRSGQGWSPLAIPLMVRIGKLWPRELFLVAATKPGYTFLSTCIGELEALSSPSFGSAQVCAVQVLFVPVDERWQKRSCITARFVIVPHLER